MIDFYTWRALTRAAISLTWLFRRSGLQKKSTKTCLSRPTSWGWCFTIYIKFKWFCQSCEEIICSWIKYVPIKWNNQKSIQTGWREKHQDLEHFNLVIHKGDQLFQVKVLILGENYWICSSLPVDSAKLHRSLMRSYWPITNQLLALPVLMVNKG